MTFLLETVLSKILTKCILFLSFQCPPANISMKMLFLLQILGALISTKRRKLAHLCCCYRKYQVCLWSIGLLNEAYSPRSRTLKGFMEVHLLSICYHLLPLGDFCRGLHLFTLLTHSVDSLMHLLWTPHDAHIPVSNFDLYFPLQPSIYNYKCLCHVKSCLSKSELVITFRLSQHPDTQNYP